jgi:hypothetical protein
MLHISYRSDVSLAEYSVLMFAYLMFSEATNENPGGFYADVDFDE